MAYRDISDQIDVGDIGSVSAAYVANGIVVLQIGVQKGSKGGHATINADYVPRTTVPGTLTIIGSSDDYNKLMCATVSPDGVIWIMMSSALEYIEIVTFIYPIKKK